jgi:hypothetical protein
MENNLSASYPLSQGYVVFAQCRREGLPNEYMCPWKVQNAGQVATVGGNAAAILATGIVYAYVDNDGIYNVEVPAGGDASPVGATLPARSISPLPAGAVETTSVAPVGTDQSTAPSNTTVTTTTLPTVKSGRFVGLRECAAVDYAAPQVSCTVSQAIFSAALDAMGGSQTPPAQVSATLPNGSQVNGSCRLHRSLVVCGDSEAVFSPTAAASGP